MRRLFFTATALLTLTSTALAADFDGDGIRDLAFGSPEFDNHTGQVTVLYGSVGAARYGDRVQTWDQDRAGHPDSAVDNVRYGNALAEGDFDGDGYDDLAVGAPGAGSTKGAVYVLRGSANGLTTAGAVRWDQDSPGGRRRQLPLPLLTAPRDPCSGPGPRRRGAAPPTEPPPLRLSPPDAVGTMAACRTTPRPSPSPTSRPPAARAAR